MKTRKVIHRGLFAIVDLNKGDYMKGEDGEFTVYKTYEEACDVCGMYEFEDVWIVMLMYNHKE